MKSAIQANIDSIKQGGVPLYKNKEINNYKGFDNRGNYAKLWNVYDKLNIKNKVQKQQKQNFFDKI